MNRNQRRSSGVIEGELSQDNYSGSIKMTGSALYPIEKARKLFAKHLKLTLHQDNELLNLLRGLLKKPSWVVSSSN